MVIHGGVGKGSILLLAFIFSVSWCIAQSLTWLGALNYRSTVDDAILLTILFNFGQGC